MRHEVAESWHRSAAAGVDIATQTSPITLPDAELGDYRDGHPLAGMLPLLEDVLGGAVRASDALLALTDDQGQLLWVTGTSRARHRGELIGFVEGSNWDERVAGTNAPGTALVLDRATAVTGAEHYRESVRRWNCVAAPIHDPYSGRILGILDVTGGVEVASPQTMGMVRATARLAESELARTTGPRAAPDTHSGDRFANAELIVQVLGRREAIFRVPGGGEQGYHRALSRRHSEALVLLAAAPVGLAGDELGLLLYHGGDPPASTQRAEMNRLRALLGPGLVGSRPYRLTVPVAGDWHLVAALLASGDTMAALHHYAGPILPYSDAPGVVALRTALHDELRAAVVASDRPEAMATWTRAPWGVDDYEMWHRQGQLLPVTSPLQPLVQTQLARLDRELA